MESFGNDKVNNDKPSKKDSFACASTTPDWPKEDLEELFKRIRQALPLDDPQKFTSETGVLHWPTISFNKYSPEECKEKWFDVLRPLQCEQIKLMTKSEKNVNDQTEAASKSIFQKCKGPRGRTTVQAISQRYHDRIRGLHNNLLADEPPRPPRSAFKFYWITQPMYPNINKNPIRARWKKLTNNWKKLYTDLFREKQAEYMIEFEKYLRGLSSEELLKLRVVMKQRNFATDILSSDDEDQ